MVTRTRIVAPLHALLWSLLAHFVASATTPASSVASQYKLTTSTAFPFPSATLDVSDANNLIDSGWGISKGKLENGETSIVFVDDPFPNSPVPVNPSPSSGPVLKVTYPAGSFNNATGGAQFVNLWNSSSPFQTMLVSYELAFDANFEWVKGGKLPGIRGGPSVAGCSGGKESTGTDCFTARVMWRQEGEGEIYAYIPNQSNLCNDPNVICNSDFGTSLGRGDFTFTNSQWSRVNLLVQLNNPPSASNGFMALYFNEVLAISQSGLQIRASSAVNEAGLFFSTFFGGSDSTWATPVDTHTYFRNIEMWASSSTTLANAPGGNSTGSSKSAAQKPRQAEWGWIVFVAVVMFFCGIELV